MAARWIFAVLALVFLLLAIGRAVRLGHADPAVRTWAWIALVFGAVAAWLNWTL